MGRFKMPDIHANQWVSLWTDHTIYEKMQRDGEIQKLMTGGSIIHINVDSKLTATQADALINDSIKYGMAHFALNSVYTECEDCKKVHKGNYKKCPNCTSENLTHYTRVIGYFSKVENWNKTRREQDFPNRKFLDANGVKAQLGQ
jgi:ribonucleoside-triphosphate reductase